MHTGKLSEQVAKLTLVGEPPSPALMFALARTFKDGDLDKARKSIGLIPAPLDCLVRLICAGVSQGPATEAKPQPAGTYRESSHLLLNHPDLAFRAEAERCFEQGAENAAKKIDSKTHPFIEALMEKRPKEPKAGSIIIHASNIMMVEDFLAAKKIPGRKRTK